VKFVSRNNLSTGVVMFIHQNLKILRKRKGFTQQEVATVTGLNRSSLAGYELQIQPDLGVLIKLSELYNVTIDTMVKVDLSRLSERQLREIDNGLDSYINGNKLRVLTTTVDSENRDNIEVVGLRAKASYLAGYADPEFMAELPLASLPFLDRNKKYRVFQVDGDSMLPIKDKSWIVGEYLDDWTTVKDGQMCIILTENEGVVFKIAYNKVKTDSKLLLCSQNPLYKPFEVEIGDVKEVWKYVMNMNFSELYSN
jgi:transcriptional regulator with XRE-family HTH domain